MSLEMAHKVIVPQKKNYVPKFLKQRDIGNFMYPSAVLYCCCVFCLLLGVLVCCVCSCVLEGCGGLLVALLCEQVFSGRGLAGRAPPPPPTIV